MTIDYSFRVLEAILLAKPYVSREDVLSTCDCMVKVVQELDYISDPMKASFAEARNKLRTLNYEEMKELISILLTEEVEPRIYDAPQKSGDGAADYANGVECFEKEDYRNAFACFKSGSEKGHTKAQYNYGVCLYNGIGTQIDRVTAIKQFVEASNDGLGQADVMIDYIMNKRYGQQ